VNNNVFVLGSSGGHPQVWQYTGGRSPWTQTTPSRWNVTQMWVTGDLLFAEADAGQGEQIYEFVPSVPGTNTTPGPGNWTVLTGTNTKIDGLPVPQGNGELFLLGSNGGGEQVWQFQGIASLTHTNWGWLPLTQTSTFNVSELYVDNRGILEMFASQNGGASRFFDYGGSPNVWTPAP
jgi:hypothetical protein